MTLSLPSPNKSLAVFAALAWTALTIGTAVTPAPVQAATGGAFYRAELSTPADSTNARPIVSGQVWKCSGTACVSGEATSRPAIVCARIAKEVGPLAAFTAGEKVFAAEELARCNGK